MAAAHARPRSGRSGGWWLVLITVLAIALAVAATQVTTFEQLRWIIAGIAVLAVMTVVLAWTELRRMADDSAHAVAAQRAEVAALRRELSSSRELNRVMLLELSVLRAQVADYVTVVPVEPEPVYPSLQLPLVRAAFDQPPITLTIPETVVPAEIPPEVSVSGAEPVVGRRVVDLAAAEARASVA
jgi:hypothetical protein